jgi:shikimate dehydrogenase
MTAPYAEVIGDPISQSKSPLIHGFWLDRLGIDADYRACHVRPEGLADYIASRRRDPDWRGCNVTVPHKLAVLDHVGDPGGVRDSIGAANTVCRAPDGDLFCTNTDAAGFVAPLLERGIDLSGRPVAVIGAGGAARAVLFALAQSGIASATILNRSPDRAARLLDQFGLDGEALPLDAPLPPVALVVNASTLGMTGQPPLALDLSGQPDDCLVYDIVYSPLETGLLAAARARDLVAIDGLDMLIGQAAVAFELFFGAAPPRDEDDDLRALLTA